MQGALADIQPQNRGGARLDHSGSHLGSEFRTGKGRQRQVGQVAWGGPIAGGKKTEAVGSRGGCRGGFLHAPPSPTSHSARGPQELWRGLGLEVQGPVRLLALKAAGDPAPTSLSSGSKLLSLDGASTAVAPSNPAPKQVAGWLSTETVTCAHGPGTQVSHPGTKGRGGHGALCAAHQASHCHGCVT